MIKRIIGQVLFHRPNFNLHMVTHLGSLNLRTMPSVWTSADQSCPGRPNSSVTQAMYSFHITMVSPRFHSTSISCTASSATGYDIRCLSISLSKYQDKIFCFLFCIMFLSYKFSQSDLNPWHYLIKYFRHRIRSGCPCLSLV